MRIDINVPNDIVGDWKVETFEVRENELSQRISMIKTGRGVPCGVYKRLMRNSTLVMSNTPDEISDFIGFVHVAKGNVLVNGLGLGVLLKALMGKEEITKITVIENSADVIKLCAPTYEVDNRVTIICADAFEYTPTRGERFDYVWHDIWDYITADNLPEMKKLTRKYGRISDYQESWCRHRCERQLNRYC